MEKFDFNQFQREIFKEVFDNLHQKAPEVQTSFDIERDFTVKAKICKRKPVAVKPELKVKTLEKVQGKPKASRKRKISEDEDFIIENERKNCSKVFSNSTKASKKYLCFDKNVEQNLVTIKTTQFERYQKSLEKNEDIQESGKNVRRSLRAKLRKSKSVEVRIEIIEKELHEITNQDEFLYFVGLRKN